MGYTYTGMDGNKYDSTTGKMVSSTSSGSSSGASFNGSSIISNLRAQMQNGTITPDQAKQNLTGQLEKWAQQNAKPYNFQDYASQLFAPMTINKGGQIMSLNGDGSVTVKSTSVNQSTTTGSGTTTSVQNQTPEETCNKVLRQWFTNNISTLPSQVKTPEQIVDDVIAVDAQSLKVKKVL